MGKKQKDFTQKLYQQWKSGGIKATVRPEYKPMSGTKFKGHWFHN